VTDQRLGDYARIPLLHRLHQYTTQSFNQHKDVNKDTYSNAIVSGCNDMQLKKYNIQSQTNKNLHD